jgi:hypothetical protein
MSAWLCSKAEESRLLSCPGVVYHAGAWGIDLGDYHWLERSHGSWAAVPPVPVAVGLLTGAVNQRDDIVLLFQDGPRPASITGRL